LSGWFRSRSIGNRSCAVVRHLPVRLGEKVRPDRNKAHFFATASQSGSVADRRIHHAASTLYHTWKGSVLFAVVMAVIALLATVLHAFEAGAWAVAYRLLGAVPDNKSAMLYSLSAITSYGHATLFLEHQWQLMGALGALNGMLLFGLTTAFLFAMIQKPQTQCWKKVSIACFTSSGPGLSPARNALARQGLSKLP
jgi:hypothetical protein